jgi:bacillithiol system protein YtxJ
MGIFSSTAKASFPWKELTSEEQLMEALNTKDVAVFIFKHSTRCSISSMAKTRFEREWSIPEFPFELLYLDLLNFRSVSNKIAEVTGVMHQSPQLIVCKNGEVLYNDSHSGIDAQKSIESAK